MLDADTRTDRPRTAEEVVALVAEAGAAGRKVEVIGGGTRRSIGEVAADQTLSTARLDKVIDYAPEELVLTAQPGARLVDLERLIEREGQMLAFEPPRWRGLLHARGEPTLGGALATNLSGPRRIRTGAARDHLLGFEAVSGRGEAFKAGGKVVKNVTGYDLMKLMAGSWGTLAVMTEVTIKVLPAPKAETTLLLFGLADVRAAEAMQAAMNGPYDVSAAAHLPAFAAGQAPLKAQMPTTAIRLEGFEASVAARAENLAAALKPYARVDRLDSLLSRDFWRQVREVEAFSRDPRPLWRLSMPPAAGWKTAHAIPGQALYDWAGGLVWMLADVDAPTVRSKVAALGGHALCLRGAPAFAPPGGPLGALQSRVKDAFDPLGVLNPGRMG